MAMVLTKIGYNAIKETGFLCSLTGQIISGRDAKLVTIISVILAPSLDGARVSAAALSSIDGFNCGAEALTGSNNGVDVVHPKPEGGLKGHGDVVGHGFGRVEAIEPDAFSCGSVVVVPGYLEGTAAIVAFVGVAWILGVRFVAVIFRGTIDLFNVAKICTQEDQLSYLKQSRSYVLAYVSWKS